MENLMGIMVGLMFLIHMMEEVTEKMYGEAQNIIQMHIRQCQKVGVQIG